MKEFLQTVFDTYCKKYSFILREKEFKPLNEKRGTFHESNQVRFFLNAYEQQGGNVITWTELPVIQLRHRTKAKTAHIDGFIVDLDRKALIFVEAKRFSREIRIDELKDDINRLFVIRNEYYLKEEKFKGLDLLGFDAYAVALADLWMDDEKWKEKVFPCWEKKAGILENGEASTLLAKEREIIPDYHLLFAVQPLFKAEKYQAKRKEHLEKGTEPASPDLLPWADEFGFENCLAQVRLNLSK